MNSSRRTEFVLLCVTAVALALALLVLLSGNAGERSPLLAYGSQGFVYLSAAVFLAFRARSSRMDWLFISGAFLVMTVSSVSYYFSATVEVAGHEMDFGDAVWLIAYPLAITGVARLARRGRRASALEWLDVLMVSMAGFSVAALVMAHVIEGAIRNSNTADITVNVVSVLFDLVLLSVALGAVQRAKWRPDSAVWMLSLAAFLYAVFDSEYAVQIITDTYVWGGFFDIAWPLSAFLFVVAAWVHRSVEVQHDEDASSAHMIIPAVFTLVAGAVLVASAPGALGLVAKAFAALALVLAVSRMYLSVLAISRLAAQLRIAHVDGDTGLPNRRWLLDSDFGNASGVVVVEFALDGLSEVHADFGTRVGVQVLNDVAARIRGCIRSDDVLLRSGEERVAVVLRESTPTSALRLTESVLQVIEQPMRVDGFAISVSASAGVSSQGGSASLPGDLLAEAAIALLESQRSGSVAAQVFSGRSSEGSQERLRARAELRDALQAASDELVPYFQPIVHAATGELLGVEGLLFWHRDGRVVPQDVLLTEVADGSSLRAFTELSMNRCLSALRASGVAVPLAVKVRMDVLDAEFPSVLQTALQKTGSTPEQMIIEVPWHLKGDGAQVAESVITNLRRIGVRVMLDDFGAPDTSIAALRSLIADGVKFAPAFIEGMWAEPRIVTLVTGAVALAQDLGAFVVFEGVATADECTKFTAFSGAYLQGAGLARPMIARDLSVWLSTRGSSAN